MTVEEAARALVARLDTCMPALYRSTHFGVPYRGPTFGNELEALRAALEHKED